MAEVAPAPHALCPGIFALDRELRHFGFARLPTRTTLVRLDAGGVIVVSPPSSLDAATQAAIESIGFVSDVVVPNSFHHLFAAECMERFPSARLLVPPLLGERVPELAAATELDEHPPASWRGELETLVLGPVRGISEVLLFHVSSGTLILTDLAFNVVRHPRALDRLVWRLGGIPNGFGPGRTTRNLLLPDREVATACLERMLEWPIERVIVSHGDVVEGDALALLRVAFREYLPDDLP